MSESADANDTPKNGPPRFHAPETSVRDYLRVVSTRRLLVFSVFLMTVVAAGLWVYTRTPIYRSGSLLLIKPGNPKVAPFAGVMDETAYVSAPRHSFLETQMRLITADRIVERTFHHFGVGKMPQFAQAKNPLDKFRRLFSVVPVRRTWLVEVTFDWPDARQGAQILDYHAGEYVEDYTTRKEKMAAEGLRNLEKERAELEPTLHACSAQLQAFKEKHKTVAFDREHDTVREGLMARQKAEDDARKERDKAKAQLDQIEEVVANDTPPENLPKVLSSQQIGGYLREKVKCEQDLDEGLKRFGVNHPEIKRLKTRLDRISKSIQLEIDKIVQAARLTFEEAEKLLADRLREKKQYEDEVQSFNKLNDEYKKLKAKFDGKQAVYAKVVGRIDEIKIARASSIKGDTIRVESPPKQETEPAKPRKTLIMGLASLLGLALGIGLAFLFDGLDTTLKTKADIARQLGLNMLGYVPEVPELRGSRRRHSQVALAMLRHPRSAVAEAFRSIRTALSFAVAAQDVEHILVTSASPSEGKTLVAVNIGAAIAQTGKNVLLVDADMRKPAVHKIFEADQTPGLTNLLVGEGAARLEDVVRDSEVPNLHYICCGAIPPNPAELIGCDRMKALLAKMAGTYDCVIIDTPPVVNVTDATVLCSAAQGVVLVIRSFRTQRELARRAVEVLGESGARFLGVVLNNVDIPRGAYGYDGYYYYQQYYYYAEDGARKKREKKKKRRRREQDEHKATA